jgi:hypothetical protein
MPGLGLITSAAFLIWMSVGLIVYFSYGRKTSTLQNAPLSSPVAR